MFLPRRSLSSLSFLCKDKRFGGLSYIYSLRLFLARSEKPVFSGQGIFALEIHSAMQLKETTREEYHRRINLLIEYINNHLDETIDLSLLADKCGFSRWHFHRIVGAFLGEPIGAFIVRMRIETAARLLRYTNLPIKEIAYKVGYDMPSSLSKTFRQFYGISPNEYRTNKEYVIMQPTRIQPDLQLQVEIKEVPLRQVAYIRLTGSYQSIDYLGTWLRLMQYLKEQNAQPADCCPICIYHDDPKVTSPDKLRTDICAVCHQPVQPRGEMGVKHIGGNRQAVFLYQGPYQNLQAVYDTIYGKLLPEKGYALRDEPGAERYLNNPQDTKPEELLTEIYIPVE